MMTNNSSSLNKRPGFTLFELLSAAGKIAVVGAIVLPILGHAHNRTHQAANGELAAPKSKPAAGPKIVKKELTISCAVTAQSPNGVILAQGGNLRGYVVYLKGGKPIFSVRQNGKLYTAASKSAVKGRFLVKAHLAKDGKLSLAINGKVVATGKAPGLFANQPKEELSIGKDTSGNVGDYKAPNPLKGKVENVKIDAK